MFAPYVTGRRILDFGAAYGISMIFLAELGPIRVVGVEPDAEHVKLGQGFIAHDARLTLLHVPDTRQLPFPDRAFDCVIANAVLEHIPRPRGAYIAELWRVLDTRGFLVVNETPNVYLPRDFHTTGLPLLNWFPSKVARRIAIETGRHPTDCDWEHSGWRGIGYFELARHLPGHKVINVVSRLRHRVLKAMGLPAAILDPWPFLVFEKTG